MDDSTGTGPRTRRGRRRPARLLLLTPVVLAAGVLAAACEPDPTTCNGRPATILGTDGNDLLEGTSGADVIVGRAGQDTIRGFGGNDTLCGGPDGDTIEGGDDHDTIDGGGGTDTIRGDAGTDTLTHANDTTAVVVNLEKGEGGDLDPLTGIEDVVGSRFADFLIGDAGENRLVGGPGSDTLNGRGGNDQLADGGAATDRNLFVGGPGNDILFGGASTDTAGYHGGQVPFVWVNLASGLAFGDGDDLLSGIDGIIGTEGGDTLQGDAGPNRIEGRGGDDFIRPVGGDDVVVGGLGRDTMSWFGLTAPVTANLVTGQATGDGTDTMSGVEDLAGGNGNDSLTGDPGPNVIDGSNGVDSCVGGGGLDTFFRCP